MILLPQYLYDTVYVVEERLSYIRKLYILFFHSVKNVSASMKCGTLSRVLKVSLRMRAGRRNWPGSHRVQFDEETVPDEVTHGILALRGCTDTNGIHYYSKCVASHSRLAGFFVNADETMKKSNKNAFTDLLNRILTLVAYYISSIL